MNRNEKHATDEYSEVGARNN